MSDRPRAWNSTLPVPSKPIERQTPLRAKKRSASEFRRIYGSRERVKAIKAMPCTVPHCARTPCDNAHLTNGGTGRKADWDTIAPLCRHHHNELDAMQGSVTAFDTIHGTDLWATAKRLAKELKP